MQRVILLFFAMVLVGGFVISRTVVSAQSESGDASPIYGVKIPDGYRDWKLISVAHEEGSFDQLRAQLGNDIAVKAYRDGTLP